MAGTLKPLIVTAELGGEDQAWFDGLRKRHFPPERNHLAAHLTMFHQLPPSAEAALKRLLSDLAKAPPPAASVGGIMDLGGGTAFRIRSHGLESIRNEIAEHFHGMLSAQDAQGWIPHITVQNKVRRAEAIEVARALNGVREGEPVRVDGLGVHRYLGGPWERVAAYKFRGR